MKDKTLFIFKSRKKVVTQVFENENKNSDHTVAQTIQDLSNRSHKVISSLISTNYDYKEGKEFPTLIIRYSNQTKAATLTYFISIYRDHSSTRNKLIIFGRSHPPNDPTIHKRTHLTIQQILLFQRNHSNTCNRTNKITLITSLTFHTIQTTKPSTTPTSTLNLFQQQHKHRINFLKQISQYSAVKFKILIFRSPTTVEDVCKGVICGKNEVCFRSSVVTGMDSQFLGSKCIEDEKWCRESCPTKQYSDKKLNGKEVCDCDYNPNPNTGLCGLRKFHCGKNSCWQTRL
jgi:hypothetical protein